MMYPVKKVSLALFVLLSFQAASPMARQLHVYPARSASSDVATVAKVIAGVGCIAAIGYGLYKLYDWLFSPTNETLLQNSLNALQDSRLRYADVIRFMDGQVAGIPVNVAEQKQLINGFSEATLYELAVSYIKEASYAYQTNLYNTIYNLRSTRDALVARIKKLANKPEHAQMRSQMQELERETAQWMSKLQFLHDYIGAHQSYFRLFELEYKILRVYEFELNALNQQTDSAYLREAIRASVMKHAWQDRLAYPYMHYVDTIQGYMNGLERESSHLAYNYSGRLGSARAIFERLRAIYSLVIVEDAYHQELRDYERAQIEKQKLEAEKAQAAAAAAQAAAMQQQAYAMQQANALQAQQNALIAAHVVNPKPQVTVYL